MASQNPALVHRKCEVCKSEVDLVKCASCRVVWYCCDEHRLDHQILHKEQCETIKKCRDELDTAYATSLFYRQIREILDKKHFGVLQLRKEDKKYYQGSYNLIDALLEIHTTEAVEIALQHLNIMLLVCPRDEALLRRRIPAMLLRLGKDQECYGLVKRWNGGLPFDTSDKLDVFEPCNDFLTYHSDLNYLVAMTLLKVKLLLNLQTLQDTFHRIKGENISPAILGRTDLINCPDQSSLLQEMDMQIDILFKWVNLNNEFFWPALITPGDHHTTKSKTVTYYNTRKE